MFHQLRKCAYRLIYLSLVIFGLSGTALVTMSGSAAAQTGFDPNYDPHCEVFGGVAECRYVISTSSTTTESVTTTESCTIGWSHRQATREVVTTTTYDVYLVEYQRWELVQNPFPIPDQWELDFVASGEERLPVSHTITTGKCTPITGRPPR